MNRLNLPLKNDDDVAANENNLLSLIHIPMTNKKVPITLNKQFGNYLKLKYLNNEKAININEQKEFEYVFNLGLIHAKKHLAPFDSPLLHKGKKPRKDVWVNLGRIAFEFLNCKSYPVIQSSYLAKILNKALGNKDRRVIREYRRTVLLYCNIDELTIEKCKDSRLGELDVSFFVQLIPKQYLNTWGTTSSTSFFELENESCSNTANLGIKNDKKMQ